MGVSGYTSHQQSNTCTNNITAYHQYHGLSSNPITRESVRRINIEFGLHKKYISKLITVEFSGLWDRQKIGWIILIWKCELWFDSLTDTTSVYVFKISRISHVSLKTWHRWVTTVFFTPRKMVTSLKAAACIMFVLTVTTESGSGHCMQGVIQVRLVFFEHHF